MPAVTSTAPGKIILFGEHAVVYGQPAIAVPVMEVKARAVVSPLIGKPSNSIQIEDPAFNLEGSLKDLPLEHAVNQSISLTLKELGVVSHPAFKLQLSSTIPLASGMGSGAAISAATIRAVSTFLGRTLDDEIVNQITYEIEKIHHGTPSGIDNTVITYQLPIFYIKGQAIELIDLQQTYHFVLADTGLKSSTSETVGDVRAAWQENKEKYDALFEACGDITLKAKAELNSGDLETLGNLMNENQRLLIEMGVSSPELENLCVAALTTGAFGAKLSGGGRGGIMIALVTEENSNSVSDALLSAGAVSTISTKIGVRYD